MSKAILILIIFSLVGLITKDIMYPIAGLGFGFLLYLGEPRCLKKVRKE